MFSVTWGHFIIGMPRPLDSIPYPVSRVPNFGIFTDS